MKMILFFCLVFSYSPVRCQSVSAFIKSPETNKLTVKEFNEQEIIQLTDTTLKITSYVIYFACNYDYLEPGIRCNVRVSSIEGNSLKGSNIKGMVEKFKTHFYIVLDNIKYIDKNGELKYANNQPRIDITE